MTGFSRGAQRAWNFFCFQAEDGIRDATVTGVQTCALPICSRRQQPGDVTNPAARPVAIAPSWAAPVAVHSAVPRFKQAGVSAVGGGGDGVGGSRSGHADGPWYQPATELPGFLLFGLPAVHVSPPGTRAVADPLSGSGRRCLTKRTRSWPGPS